MNLITLPIDELLKASQDYDSLSKSVCVQVSFMEKSPLTSFNFQ